MPGLCDTLYTLSESIYTHNSRTSTPQAHCEIPIAPTLMRKAMRRFTPLLSSQSRPDSRRRLSWLSS